MGKTPKGFGTPAKANRKKPRKLPKPKRIELHPLPDHEFLWQKEARICHIFRHITTIPEISITNLQQYRQHLQETLPAGLSLVIDEPLPWETLFIYGTSSVDAHLIKRQHHPSYLDQYQLITLSEEISLQTGLAVTVQRTSDQQDFTLPLHLFRINASGESNGPTNSQTQAITIADYRLWWETYQPFVHEEVIH